MKNGLFGEKGCALLYSYSSVCFGMGGCKKTRMSSRTCPCDGENISTRTCLEYNRIATTRGFDRNNVKDETFGHHCGLISALLRTTCGAFCDCCCFSPEAREERVKSNHGGCSPKGNKISEDLTHPSVSHLGVTLFVNYITNFWII